jgi:hypothetical protein
MNDYREDTIHHVGARVDGPLWSPASGNRPISDHVRATVALGGWVGLYGRPLWVALKRRFHDEWAITPHPTGDPRASTARPNHSRPYAEKGHHCFYVFALAILLAFTLFLFPLPASAHAITNTGRIYGQLLDGTKRNAPVAGQSVTLQMAQGENARDLTTITTDAHGMYSFSGLNTDKTINYALYTLYQGAQYYTGLIDLSTKPDQQINLAVYDATTRTSSIAVVQANVLIDKADAKSGLITISENYIFENLGPTTYVGSLQSHGSMPNALRFSLPKNARNVSLKSGFDGYQVIQVDSGFATDAAIPPGMSQFAFSFQAPYTTPSYDFSYTVVYPTVNLSLLVPLNMHASSAGMDSQGPVNANQTTFQQFNAKKLLANAQIHVQLDGLPVSQQAVNPQPLNRNTLLLILAVLLMLAIVSVTWLMYRLSRRRAPTRRKQTLHISSNKAFPSQNEQQEALLQELLHLDKAYETGTIKKSVYEQRRTKTKTELRDLMNKDIVEQSATVKKTARSSGKGAT